MSVNGHRYSLLRVLRMTDQPERIVLVTNGSWWCARTDSFDEAVSDMANKAQVQKPTQQAIEILEVRVIRRATVRTEVKVDEG